MMTEDEVVAALCAYLEARGWNANSRNETSQRGIDIVAERLGKKHFVIVRGTARGIGEPAQFARPAGSARSQDHLTNAIFTAMALSSDEPATIVAIALPNDAGHRRRNKRAEPALERLGIGAFWISDGGGREVLGLNLD